MADDGGQALLLTISADTSKAIKSLDNLNRKLSGLGPEFERHGKKAAEGIERGIGSIDVRKALDKVFDSSKLAVIEEGSTKLRIFGSAIEPLGPLGIAAAAGVVALGAAFEEAHKAIEYADSLYKAAQAAHVSTDALQEYRAAIVKAGGDANAAGPALLQFSEVLGKAAEGLKGLRPFQALFGKGFKVSDVKGLGTDEQALDAVVAKIQNLSSRAQQDAAISRFGLQGLAPLILAGADAWKSYREEAKAAGLVLDADVIRRGHELNVQMDELTGKIKNELTTAFINIGPVLVGLLGLIDKMLIGINKFSGEIARDPVIQAIIATSLGPKAADAVQRFGESQVAEFGVSSGLTEAQLQAGLGPKKGTGNLADLSKTAKGSDQTAEFNKAALDALNTALHAQAQAQAALITGIYAHAEAEKDAVDKGLTKKLDDLELEAQKIATAKNDADKLAQRAKINSAKVAEQQAAEAQKQLIDQQATTRALEAWLASADKIQSDAARISSNSAHMAVTAADRNAIETRGLLQEQARERSSQDLRFQDELSHTLASDRPDVVARQEQERAATLARQESERQTQAFDQANPIEKYARSIQDLKTEVQGDAVGAFQDLTSGLIDAAMHAKNLGDVAKNVFLNLIQQILTQTLQKEALPGLEAAGSALLHFIPGFASGTNSAPGGLALVGEKGPELVNLPRGASVAPTFQTLNALNSMKAPRAASVTVIQPFHFHAEGAVMTEDLLMQANSNAAQLAAQAGRQARSAAVGDVRRAGYLGNLNQ
jgi:hypothetical protein